jgi:hypothetical protein
MAEKSITYPDGSELFGYYQYGKLCSKPLPVDSKVDDRLDNHFKEKPDSVEIVFDVDGVGYQEIQGMTSVTESIPKLYRAFHRDKFSEVLDPLDQPYLRIAGTDHKLKADDVAAAMNLLTETRTVQIKHQTKEL